MLKQPGHSPWILANRDCEYQSGSATATLPCDTPASENASPHSRKIRTMVPPNIRLSGQHSSFLQQWTRHCHCSVVFPAMDSGEQQLPVLALQIADQAVSSPRTTSANSCFVFWSSNTFSSTVSRAISLCSAIIRSGRQRSPQAPVGLPTLIQSFISARVALIAENLFLRKQLRGYLHRPDIDVTEVAYLLGYEDSNSFYRAFRTWEGTTPSQLRAELKQSDN